MTVVDVLRFLVRYWRSIVVGGLLGILAGVAYASTLPRVYTASSIAYVLAGTSSSTTDAAIGQSVAASKAQQYIPLMTSEQVAKDVIAKLHLDAGVGEVAGSISASADPGSSTIRVSVSSGSPQRAQDIANAVVAAAAKEASLLESNGTQTSTVRMTPINSAVLPTAPSSPNVKRIVGEGALLGLLLGAVLAFLRRQLDTRIRRPEDIAEVTPLGIIGALPQDRALRQRRHDADVLSGIVGEACRHLRTNLVYADPDHTPRIVLVTSPQAGEGKSTVAALLARSLAMQGEQVVLVDADLRRPTVEEFFDVDRTVGTTQVLAGDVTLAEALVQTDAPGLFALPAGRLPHNPAEVVGSKKFDELLHELAVDHRVVIDAPPLLPVTDAVILATRVDGVLVVTLDGMGRKEHLARALGLLGSVRANVLGVVLNGVPHGRTAGLYGYSGYSYAKYETRSSGKRRRGRGKPQTV